jgi:uncharacterized membrane protein YeiH
MGASWVNVQAGSPTSKGRKSGMWNPLILIGTAAFAASGAIVAREESYDVVGVFVLGMVTAFVGGIIKNLLIGVPVALLWHQYNLLLTAAGAIVVVLLLPGRWVPHWRRWVKLFDALGLIAFALLAALQARSLRLPLSAIVISALLTAVGGGIVRDLLAGRKPLVFHDEIYAVWAIVAGLVVALGWVTLPVPLAAVFVVLVALRVASIYKHWTLPRMPLYGHAINTPPPGVPRNRQVTEEERP